MNAISKGKIVPLALAITAMIFSSPAYSIDAMQGHQETSNCRNANMQAFPKIKLSEKLYGLPGIDNVGRISPCIYRGKQPTSKGYLTLKTMGVKTVINLRSAHGEKEEVEKAGMAYMEFPLSMASSIQKERFLEIIRAMSEPLNQPVYIHCALGQDRTGVVVAAYRIDMDGWSFEDAEKEMQSFGCNDTWIHLKKSLKNFTNHSGKVLKP